MKNIKKYVNEYVSPYGYMVLVIFLSRSFYSGIGFSNILLNSKKDTWLSLLIGFVIGFIPILSIRLLNNRNINLLKVIHSKIIKFIIILVLIFSFTTLLNDFINFCNVKYLFETPSAFIAILIIISSIYIVNKGIETIGRSALFMSFISIFLYIFISISLIKYIDIDNLKPILKIDSIYIIKSIILYISYTITPIILLNIIPKNDLITEEYNKCLIIGYIISFLSIFIIFFFITTIYNYEYISLFNYPAYFALKKIDYNFISNVENIYSLFFIIDYFYSITTYIYIIKYYLKNEFNISNYYVLLIILVYISTYLFKNINIVHFITNKLLHSVLLTFILFFILIAPLKKDS